MKTGNDTIINSIIDSGFTCSIKELANIENYRTIILEVAGSVYITGRNEFIINPDDPLNRGFILR
ncbi:MAG: proline racemase family protein [Thermodesulfobacteriota bacterium]